MDKSSTQHLPKSKKVFVQSQRIPDVRVPFREIELSSTTSYTGTVEANEPVRVYDTSGPINEHDITKGIPALRASWIQERGDVEEYEGRNIVPIDNGYDTTNQSEHAISKGNLVEY